MFFAEISVYRAGHQQVPPEETQMLVVCQPGLLCATSLWGGGGEVIPGIERDKREE